MHVHTSLVRKVVSLQAETDNISEKLTNLLKIVDEDVPNMNNLKVTSGVTVTIGAGGVIGESIQKLMKLSRFLDVIVYSEFNGKTFHILPGDTFESACNRYDKELVSK